MKIHVLCCIAGLGCLLQLAAGDAELRVPRLLHRNYMAGAEALYAATQDDKSGFKAHWLSSCKTHNPGWQEIIWDESAVMQLVQEDFPWFLETYLSYPKLVQRSDVTRYMVLYKHGGVYLDADVECYSSFEASLRGKDLVLNCEYAGSNGQLHNAAMASAAGHPFWLEVLREAMQRAPRSAALPAAAAASSPASAAAAAAAAAASSSAAAAPGRSSSPRPLAGALGLQGQVLGRLQQLWEASPFHNKVNAVLRTTGPMMLTSVYKRYVAGAAMCGATVEVDGRLNHAYELGSWFTPCFFSDEACQRKWMTQHFLLTREGSQQAAAAAGAKQQQPAAARVVGIHHYSGSWTDWDHSKKQQKQQEMKQEAAQNVLTFFRDSPAFLEYSCSARLPTGVAASSSSSSSSSRPQAGPMPLCMEFVLDALSMDSCAMVSVLEPLAAQPEAAGGATGEATPDVATEQLLQQLGCHVMTVTPNKQPPQQLRFLHSDSSSSGSKWLQHRGLVQHLQGELRAVPEYGAEPPALSLQALLHLDPRAAADEVQEQQQKQQGLQAADARAHVPLKYILRLSCSGCELAVLQHLFSGPMDDADILQHIELLLLDLQQKPATSAASAGGSAGGSAAAAGGAAVDVEVAAGLDDVYNLLYQQQGFVGFLRQQLPGGVLRLGFARHPGRMKARGAVLGSSRDQQLLQQLGS